MVANAAGRDQHGERKYLLKRENGGVSAPPAIAQDWKVGKPRLSSLLQTDMELNIDVFVIDIEGLCASRS